MSKLYYLNNDEVEQLKLIADCYEVSTCTGNWFENVDSEISFKSFSWAQDHVKIYHHDKGWFVLSVIGFVLLKSILQHCSDYEAKEE